MPFLKEVSLAMRRRKPIQRASGSDTKLDRCLGTFDLTALGTGSTLGLGIYVLAGQVASLKAGPAVIISFLIAAFASILAGLCYAEFGARVPAAGSAYIYSYVSIGEFMAFLIGWNLIVEYLIGTASGARGYSGYIDSLFDGKLQESYKNWFPGPIPGTNEYPDLIAAAITILITLLTAVGMKDSSRFNTIFTGVNLAVVLYVIIVGMFYADLDNWNIDPSSYQFNSSTSMLSNTTTQADLNRLIGQGGFFPFGMSGVLAGAATCFYGFIGFDVIATTGEEVRNSKRAIPLSIVLSLGFVLIAYFCISAVQTLMWPYWEQNQPAPLPYIFEKAGLPTSRYVITVGSLAGLSTSLLGALYPLPRVLYAMSSDGLIFRAFSRVNPRTKTPLFATIFSGAWAAIMATMFRLQELADMMSIGTLLAYSLVAISVLILRYDHEYPAYSDDSNHIKLNDINTAIEEVDPTKTKSIENVNLLRRIINYPSEKSPSKYTTSISCYLIWTIVAFLIIFDYLIILFESELGNLEKISSFMILSTFMITVFLVIGLARQPCSDQELSFKVPLVPFVPLLSCAINFYLMFKLSQGTWIRFGIWLVLGLITYFAHGIRNSDERIRQLGIQNRSDPSTK